MNLSESTKTNTTLLHSTMQSAIFAEVLRPVSVNMAISLIVQNCWNLPETKSYLAEENSVTRRYQVAMCIGNAFKAYVNNDSVVRERTLQK